MNTSLINPNSKKLTFLKALILLIAFLISSLVQAGTCTWNSTYGNWSDPSNWSPVGVPTASDEVVISTGKMLIDIEANITSLSMSGGTISGTENLTLTGDFDWSGGTISADAVGPTLTVGGNASINAINAKTLSFRKMILNGTVEWSDGNINIGSGTSFVIASGAIFNINLNSGATLGSTSDGIIDVQGTLNKNLSTIANYNGIFNVNGGNLNITAGVLNGSFASSGTHTGNLNISPGGTFQFSGGTHDFSIGSSVSGSGKVKASGAIVNFHSAHATAPNLEITSGTLNDNGGMTVPNVTHSQGTFSGIGTTIVNGTYTWSGGTVSGTGSTTADSMILEGSSKTLQNRLFVLSSYGTWTDGHIRISSNGVFRVTEPSVFNINHSGSHDFGSASDGLIDILGTVNKITDDRTSIKCEIRTSSTASLNIASGIFRTFTSSSGTYQGATTIASGANFWFYRGTHHFNNGSSVSGDGTLKVTNDGDANFNAGSSLSSAVEISGGILTDAVGFTPSSIAISGGEFTGSGNGNCTGDMAWSGGTISGTGSFSVANTAAFTGTSRSLDTKELIVNGIGNWQTGDFVLSNNAIIRVGVGADFQLNHTAVQSLSGTGTFLIDGTMSKREALPESTIGLGAVIDGTVIGKGPISFSTLNNKGAFSPGLNSIGQLTLNAFDNSNGTLNIEINGTGNGGIDYDLLAMNGSASLGGTLSVSLLNGFVPNVGNQFTILTGSNIVGAFSIKTLPALPSDRQWLTHYNASDVTLEVASLLPVELTRFEAKPMENAVQLKWQTATEEDNRGFDIQRSPDGIRWKSIRFVDGYGTSFSENNYETMDYPGIEGTYYYRLRQVDWNGDFDLSQVRSVTLTKGDGHGFFEVNPNPIKNNEINIQFQSILEQIAFYEITDMKGSLVEKGILETGESNFKVYFQTPINGYYNLNIQSGAQRQSHKILIQ